MRILIAFLLWAVGVGIVLYGLGNALLELGSLYQGAITDPLNQPEGAEKVVSAHMVRMLIIGAAGLPFLIVGTVMIRSNAGRRRRALLIGRKR